MVADRCALPESLGPRCRHPPVATRADRRLLLLLVARDPDAHRLLGARQPPRDPRTPTCLENSALPGSSSSGQRSCRCHSSVLLSATRWRTRRSRWSTSSRKSSSGPASCAVGRFSMPSRSAARATASASIRSDLPRSRLAAPRVGHQLRRDANDALAAADQKPLERAGDVPAVLQRPDSIARRDRAPIGAARANPRAPTADRLLAEHLAGRRGDRGDRVRALVHVRTEHDHPPRPFSSRLKWTPGGHGLLRARPRSYQVTPDIPDRRRAT